LNLKTFSAQSLSIQSVEFFSERFQFNRFKNFFQKILIFSFSKFFFRDK